MLDTLLISGNQEALQKVPAQEIINNEELYDLDVQLVPLIGSNQITGGYEVYRTKTEGRGGVLYFPKGFNRKDSGAHFHYVLYKGIGKPDRQERYGLEKMKNGSYPGFDTVEDVISDHVTNEYLASQGLRTRQLIKLWELDDDVIVDIASGPTSIKDVKKTIIIRPSVAAWAMRCRDRVQDVYSEINEVIDPKEIRREEMGRAARRRLLGQESYTHTPFDIDLEQIEQIFRKMIDLAKIILISAFDDTDLRFKMLYSKFSYFLAADSEGSGQIDQTEIGHFFEEYLGVFAEVLGEQFAVLENCDATIGMFNHQNITLLAELVDHDVTLIGGKSLTLEDGQIVAKEIDEETRKLYKLEDSSLEERSVQQLFQAWESIAKMISRFSQLKIIKLPVSSQIPLLESVTERFLTGFLSKLEPDVIKKFMNKLQSVLQQESDYFKPGKNTDDPLGQATRIYFFSAKLAELTAFQAA
jgi:hypothetical protein